MRDERMRDEKMRGYTLEATVLYAPINQQARRSVEQGTSQSIFCNFKSQTINYTSSFSLFLSSGTWNRPSVHAPSRIFRTCDMRTVVHSDKTLTLNTSVFSHITQYAIVLLTTPDFKFLSSAARFSCYCNGRLIRDLQNVTVTTKSNRFSLQAGFVSHL